MAGGLITAVWSPKGGVGKTLLSVALALKLAEKRRAVLIDGNADNPDIVSLLQCPSLPNIGTWPSQADPASIESHLVRRSSRLFILPGPTRFIDEAALSGEAMEAALRALSAAGMAVVVDCSTSLRDSTLVALDLADRILIPVTLDLLSLTPLKRVARELELLKLPVQKFRVVINRHTDTKEITAEDIRLLSPFPVLGVVPSNRHAAQAINRGDLELAVGPASTVGRAVAALVGNLAPEQAESEARPVDGGGSLLGRLRILAGKEGV
jgi:pilus assembly protein CpaE